VLSHDNDFETAARTGVLRTAEYFVESKGIDMARLIFSGEKFGGQVYEFVVAKTAVGRGDHNDLTIRDESVSMNHCEILVHGNEVIVRDLGARNGTFIDKVLLRNQQRELKHGQVVGFGTVEARLELDRDSEADTSTEETAMYSYRRYLEREKESKTAPPVHASLPAQSGEVWRPDEHTVLLPKQPGSAPVEHAASVNANADAANRSPKPGVRLLLILALFLLGLVVTVWLLFGFG
jgi:predicted component of type VI protein secretion system